MTTASDTQIQFLLDLAYTHACLEPDEIRTYLDKFRQMTPDQASTLIENWQAIGKQRHIDNTTRIIWRPNPPVVVQPTTPAAQPPRLINAKYASTCSICHSTIHVGDPIWYTKGFYATHKHCGYPTVKSGSASTTTAPPVQAPATAPSVKHACPRCTATFYDRTQMERHYKIAHMAPVHPPEPPEPPITLPMKGYYAIELPIDGVMTWRFYRVTESRKYVYGANHPEAGQKVRTFRRISGDNMLGIESQEKIVAAALINAAPGLAQEAYGKKIGHCGCCGRQLTDPESRARGIGPECYGKYGARYV